MNLPLSTVEVRFEKLTIAAPISVGSSGLPTITNAYRGMFDVSLQTLTLSIGNTTQKTNAISKCQGLKKLLSLPDGCSLRMLHICSHEGNVLIRTIACSRGSAF